MATEGTFKYLKIVGNEKQEIGSEFHRWGDREKRL